MAYQGVIPVNMSGKRKPTAFRCNRCSEAKGHTIWHETHRGLDPEPCPFDLGERIFGHSEVHAPAVSPALIPREKLGTPPRVKKWHVVKVGGVLPMEG
jgi:hypothetical protein